MKKIFEGNHICKNKHEFHWKKIISDEPYFGKMSDINLHCIAFKETKYEYIITIQCPICYDKYSINEKKETTK